MRTFCVFIAIFLFLGIGSAAAQDLMMKNTQSNNSKTTAIDPNKFIFGINANAGGIYGLLLNVLGNTYTPDTGSGPSLNFEFGKGNFNSEINLVFPGEGFGLLATFNYFKHSRIGGFYVGAGIGFSLYKASYYKEYPESLDISAGSQIIMATRYAEGTAFSIPLGLNIGYKFVTKSGIYFRTGTYVGFDIGWLYGWLDVKSSYVMPVYIKPDLAIGWTMR